MSALLARLKTKAFWAALLGFAMLVYPAIDSFLSGKLDLKAAIMMAVGLALHSGGTLQSKPIGQAQASSSPAT